MDFNAEFSKKIKLAELWVEDYMQSNILAPESVYEAMRYSVSAGGKRIRPVMCLAAYEMFDKNSENAAPFCAAIEMIHTYSLIHDDLPAMDNSDLRRGKPANHKVFGEANAVLAGDGLLNLAFETMLDLKNSDMAQRTIKAASFVANCSGVCGMIGGQVMDIAAENKEIDLNELQTLQIKKTGALIAAAVCSGAILAGASDDEVEALREYAYDVGLAFQIKDDILDATSDAETLGKPIGNDEKNNKNTYVSKLGLEGAKKLLEEYTSGAMDKLCLKFGEKSEFLLGLTKYLLERKN